MFLGAGTLGSTEILLRSEKRGLTLSTCVGKRFSGNGDVIAFAYNAPQPVNGFGHGAYVPQDAAVGPLISGMVDERGQSSGVMIQEGTIPGALMQAIRFLAPLMARVSDRPVDRSSDLRFRPFWRELDSVIRGVRHGALRRTQTFLGMGRDSAAGVIASRERSAALQVAEAARRWRHSHDRRTHVGADASDERPVPGEPVLVARLRTAAGDRASARRGLHGRRGWIRSRRRRRTCVLGTRWPPSARRPVRVRRLGRTARPGTNPALTITALAERIAARAGGPVLERVGHFIPPPPPRRVRRSEPGIHYAERLRGWVQLNGVDCRFTLKLHVSAESVRILIDDEDHRASLVGLLVVRRPDGQPTRFTVSDGTFSIMVDDPDEVDSSSSGTR